MIELEFSRSIVVDRLGHDERVYKIEANAAEREALARRYNILSVDAFSATVRLKRGGRGAMVRLHGHFFADVTQACVVSLEPVSAHLEEDFALTYVPSAKNDRDDMAAEIVVEMDDEDPPEPILDGTIDIGEAAAEHLALSLDPFPRAPNAVFSIPGEEVRVEVERLNPFAALSALKKK